MKTSVFFLFLFVNEIMAFTSKQLMERLHYIEDRLNDESKFRREDFSAVFQEMDNIKTKLDQILTIKKESKDTEYASVPDKTYMYTVNDDSVLLKAFKAEKVLNAQFRREIPVLKRHVQDLEITTKEFRSLFKENSLNLDKHIEQVIQTTGETLTNISIAVNELKGIHDQILENTNFHTNMTLGINNNLLCTVKKSKYMSCKDSYDKGNRVSGVYDIKTGYGKSISVYCDMTTDGGGWTVFQKREDGTVDFFRNWDEYKLGFGDVNGEFWLGNEYLNILTDTVEQHELRVDMEDFEGNRAYAKYSRFKVGPESENYKIEVSGYTGNAGDSLENPKRGSRFKHNGMEFSTKDRDNDRFGANCANDFHGAWWYNNCFESNLNSLYHSPSTCKNEWDCIVWNTWKGSKYSLKFTEMKFR